MIHTSDSAAIALASFLQSRAALEGATPNSQKPWMPWDIARYVAGDTPAREEELVRAIRTDLGLYRFYRDLLKTRASGHSLRQAAAASIEPSSGRAGDGFRLEFRNSRADPGQVYASLVLEGEPAMHGRALQVHVLATDALLRLDFPAPQDGRSQRLFTADSPELSLLRRGDSELLLVTL